DPDRIEADRDALRRFYLHHGYGEVRIPAASAQYDAGKSGIVITFRVDEGGRYRIGKADITSDLAHLDPASLRSRLRTASGDVYDADAVEKTVDDLQLELGKRGKPFAAVHPRIEPAPDGASMNVVYRIEQGRPLYVERIDIHGNTKTRDQVIRREVEIAEGDAYNRALLQRAERRLKRLALFKTVRVGERPGSAPDRVILDVTVEEQQTGDFNVAGGYSSAEGLVGQVSVSERNFLGLGVVVKAAVTYGEYTKGIDLGFSQPYVLDDGTAVGVNLFGKETLASTYQSFNSSIYGGKVAVATPLTDELGMQWHYSLYHQSLTLDPTRGVASLPVRQAALAGPMWVSAIGPSFTYSTLDDAAKPTSGFRAVVNEDVAGLGGDAKFLKTTADVRHYDPIADDVVAMERV